MNSYLSDLENIIINAQSGGQSLSFALKPCATEKSVFDKEVNITPLWLIRKQEAERKAKEETERTRLQQEAERKAKELARLFRSPGHFVLYFLPLSTAIAQTLFVFPVVPPAVRFGFSAFSGYTTPAGPSVSGAFDENPESILHPVQNTILVQKFPPHVLKDFSNDAFS